MIHHSIGTLGSTSCPPYGMSSWSTLMTSTSKWPSLLAQQGPLQKAYNTSQQGRTGSHTLYLQPQQLVGMGSCSITILVPYILAPGASLCITNGAINSKYIIFVSITFCHRPKDAMLLGMAKACLHFKIFLLFRPLMDYFLLIYKYLFLFFINVKIERHLVGSGIIKLALNGHPPFIFNFHWKVWWPLKVSSTLSVDFHIFMPIAAEQLVIETSNFMHRCTMRYRHAHLFLCHWE